MFENVCLAAVQVVRARWEELLWNEGDEQRPRGRRSLATMASLSALSRAETDEKRAGSKSKSQLAQKDASSSSSTSSSSRHSSGISCDEASDSAVSEDLPSNGSDDEAPEGLSAAKKAQWEAKRLVFESLRSKVARLYISYLLGRLKGKFPDCITASSMNTLSVFEHDCLCTQGCFEHSPGFIPCAPAIRTERTDDWTISINHCRSYFSISDLQIAY